MAGPLQPLRGHGIEAECGSLTKPHGVVQPQEVSAEPERIAAVGAPALHPKPVALPHAAAHSLMGAIGRGVVGEAWRAAPRVLEERDGTE